jgi:ubiquinone/menaquinone biosynthesis C-methylase UbiE
VTWHETIDFIRKRQEYSNLVEQAYFDEDLDSNIIRFKKSSEFIETVRLIKEINPSAQKMLDIGAGNGIASINFALLGYSVFAVEPDSSDAVGIGAIEKLIEKYKLNNIKVFQNYAEEINFPDESFDIVYFRQTMHHARDLKKFLKESARVLKVGGTLLAIRDHVIFNETDKKLFLETHPLQKFYGGENAFTPYEYKNAMRESGLKIEKEFKYYDSIINYFPLSEADVEKISLDNKKSLKHDLINKIGFLGNVPFLLHLYRIKNSFNALRGYYLNEIAVPGRMYSYIAKKIK